MAVSYFASLYTEESNHVSLLASKGAFPFIKPSRLANVEKKIFNEEIREVVFQIDA